MLSNLELTQTAYEFDKQDPAEVNGKILNDMLEWGMELAEMKGFGNGN